MDVGYKIFAMNMISVVFISHILLISTSSSNSSIPYQTSPFMRREEEGAENGFIM